MVRLAMVISNPIQYHAPLYGHLARDGRFQLKVFFMSDQGAREFYEPFARTQVKYDNLNLDDYDHVFLNQGEPRNFFRKRTPFLNFRLSEELLRFSPQAVCFHGYDNPSTWAALLSCRRKGIRTFLRGEHEDAFPRPLWKKWLRELFLKWLLPKFDGFMVIGTCSKKFLLARGIPEKKLFFVPYSVDNRYFRAGLPPGALEEIRARIRRKYGLADGTRIFIHVQKMRPVKRPLDAVEGFCRAMSAGGSCAALLMCGDGELRQSAEELAKAKGDGRVLFTGYLNQAGLREHLLASDVLLICSEEQWGCSINEALSSGLAVISSDRVLGWVDMVVPGRNGEIYPLGNVEELGRKIRQLAAVSEERLNAMKESSLALSRRLSFETCAEGIAQACGIS